MILKKKITTELFKNTEKTVNKNINNFNMFYVKTWKNIHSNIIRVSLDCTLS